MPWSTANIWLGQSNSDCECPAYRAINIGQEKQWNSRDSLPMDLQPRRIKNLIKDARRRRSRLRDLAMAVVDIDIGGLCACKTRGFLLYSTVNIKRGRRRNQSSPDLGTMFDGDNVCLK
ncbi:hypothetical protein PGTUg99_037028 [Puccinia graminis f. sp. tritici]|uniref:Uncharacterized protein n=2 Tax=Puccinia graminis f. sp. tritici TaxID=56615 RepID=A0A5B0S2P5_PUCGR|nr:hypothetical protein PGTUg99_037028 [Puccinia graminis f. sp. tritici]